MREQLGPEPARLTAALVSRQRADMSPDKPTESGSYILNISDAGFGRSLAVSDACHARMSWPDGTAGTERVRMGQTRTARTYRTSGRAGTGRDSPAEPSQEDGVT